MAAHLSLTIMFVLQGNKKQAVEESSNLASSTSSHPIRKLLPLKAYYGINAWKRWALSRCDQPEDTKANDSSKPGKMNLHLERRCIAKLTRLKISCCLQYLKTTVYVLIAVVVYPYLL